MKPEKKLSTLLQEMNPQLQEGDYVFVSVPNLQEYMDLIPATVGTFKEKEGWTLILPEKVAQDQHLDYSLLMSWITMEIHSALDAVGFTAAFSAALAGENISCNVVAGYHHDHLFVPNTTAKKAMNILGKLSQQNHYNDL